MDSISRIVPKSFFGNPTSKRSIEEQMSREISSFRHPTTNSFKTGWLQYKNQAKKVSMPGSQTSQKCKLSKFGKSKSADRFNSSWFKIVHFWNHWSDRVNPFFCVVFARSALYVRDDKTRMSQICSSLLSSFSPNHNHFLPCSIWGWGQRCGLPVVWHLILELLRKGPSLKWIKKKRRTQMGPYFGPPFWRNFQFLFKKMKSPC